MELSVVIPVYNEAPEVLQSTVRGIRTALDTVESLTYEILVVDDGSKRYQYDNIANQGVTLLRNWRNKGYGASLLEGIDHAQYEWIAITDCDGTYPADQFPALLEHTDHYDMVIGARSWSDISWIRRPAKWVITAMASFVASYPIPDLNSGMRLFKKSVVERFRHLMPMRFSFTSTLTLACLTKYYDVRFVPIPYYDRIGTSSIQPIRDTLRFSSLVLRMMLYFRPLRFFLPLSGLFFCLGAVRGLRDIYLNNYFGGLTLLLMFMCFQLFFFGLLAEIISKK